MRTVNVALGLVAAVAVLVGGALLLLQPEPASVVPPKPATDPDEPVVRELDDSDAHLSSHDQFPFGDFQGDIDRLRVPVPPPDQPSFEIQEQELNIAAEKHRFDIRMEDVTVKEVVDVLREELAKVGITVTDLDRPIPDQYRFDIYMTDTHVYDVIARILIETDKYVKYTFSEFGICIGDERTIQEWQLQSKARRVQKNAAKELDSGLLDAMVPPIVLEDAHIGAITRYLTDQTEVEIVLAPQLWHRPVRLTWKTTEPMKLREALKRLAKTHRAVIRVENERVFLIDP